MTMAARGAATEAHTGQKFLAPYDPVPRPHTVTASEGTRQAEHRNPYQHWSPKDVCPRRDARWPNPPCSGEGFRRPGFFLCSPTTAPDSRMLPNSDHTIIAPDVGTTTTRLRRNPAAMALSLPFSGGDGKKGKGKSTRGFGSAFEALGKVESWGAGLSRGRNNTRRIPRLGRGTGAVRAPHAREGKG